MLQRSCRLHRLSLHFQCWQSCAVLFGQGEFQLDAEACWAALAQHQRQQQGRKTSGRGFQNNTFMDDGEDDEDCWLEVRCAMAQHAERNNLVCAWHA